ncbi:MAG: spore coat associated protein CotJA [Lachnospiraceae bacterium]|nr:spore coat associated protein CotJA [Lachnospiraceae bacterium]
MKGLKMHEKCKDKNFEEFPVAMAYVPWQNFERLYDDLEKAYCAGTVFPELDKPFTGRRCV